MIDSGKCVGMYLLLGGMGYILISYILLNVNTDYIWSDQLYKKHRELIKHIIAACKISENIWKYGHPRLNAGIETKVAY